MKKNINYSFIIPHKNTPNLLIRCVKSIPTRNDIEIIIVDDNSSPNIVDFKQFPCSTFKNVKVIFDKSSKGAGHARNIALPLITGKWAVFADSDDFFNACFNDILNEYTNSEADIIYFNANSVDSETFEPSHRADHLHEFFNIYKSDHNKGDNIFKFLFSEPWCKICRKSIIINNNIRFDETIIDEDVIFSYTIGFYAKKICIDEREGYCVTSRKGSLCQGLSEDKIFCRFIIAAKWAKFLKDNNIQLEIKNFTYMLYNFSRNLYKDKKTFRKQYCALQKINYKKRYIWKIIAKNIWFTIKIKMHFFEF